MKEQMTTKEAAENARAALEGINKSDGVLIYATKEWLELVIKALDRKERKAGKWVDGVCEDCRYIADIMETWRKTEREEKMKHKVMSAFTEDEQKWMDTVAVNYILAQADGFQLGYAQALSDFTENIVDYWRGSDDQPQQSILDALVDLGVELGKRQEIAKKNIETSKERGYEQYYNWEYKKEGTPFSTIVKLFTYKAESEDKA